MGIDILTCFIAQPCKPPGPKLSHFWHIYHSLQEQLRRMMPIIKIVKRSRRCQGTCKRYYVHKTRTRSARIGNKRPRRLHPFHFYNSLPIEKKPIKQPLTRVPKPVTFDLSSFPIRIDSHSSYCVTNKQSDYIGPLQPISASVLGMGGNIRIRHKGTV